VGARSGQAGRIVDEANEGVEVVRAVVVRPCVQEPVVVPDLRVTVGAAGENADVGWALAAVQAWTLRAPGGGAEAGVGQSPHQGLYTLVALSLLGAARRKRGLLAFLRVKAGLDVVPDDGRDDALLVFGSALREGGAGSIRRPVLGSEVGVDEVDRLL